MQWLRINVVFLILIAFVSKADEQLIEDLRVLTSPQFEGRKTGAAEPNQSAQYLYERFRELGYSPSYQPFAFQSGWSSPQTGHNVLAFLPCSRALCSTNLVVSAHYDHLGTTGKRYYPGANDNASGVAALLYLAKVLKNESRNQNIYFLATDAEEKGLYGAYHFADSDLNQNTSLNINLDMLAVTHKRHLYVLSSRESELKELVKNLAPKFIKFKYTESSKHLGRISGENNTDWLKASDHYAFHRKDIPFLYIGMGSDSKHHTTDDTFDNIKLDLYQGAVQDIALLITTILSADAATH